MLDRIRTIAVNQPWARHLGLELVSADVDRAVLRLPYRPCLGLDRVNGGAIAALVDLAATCAFWAHPRVDDGTRGATIGFSISFLSLTVAADLTASARVRRRGGLICVGDVSVTDPAGSEIAMATVTYKLESRAPARPDARP
jgi:uncharacterized protein (TIGR00369 family)